MLSDLAVLQAGLKTGMYYLRTRAAADAIKFTVDQQALAKNKAARAAKLAVPLTPAAAAMALKVAGPYQTLAVGLHSPCAYSASLTLTVGRWRPPLHI